MDKEYDECFIGEVEIFHFENSRDALSKQSVRFDDPKLLEMSPILIKDFLVKNRFDLPIDGAVLIKSFDFMSSWEDYYRDMADWLLDGMGDGEPFHPDVICYQTSFLREM